MYNIVGAARSGGCLPSPSKGGEKMDFEHLYILAFLVIATGYILSIRGNKK